MNGENDFPWGAKMERGIIVRAEGGRYDIESFDRPGVTGYGLKALKTIEAGKTAYFFLFRDGKGLIIAEAE